MQMKPLPKFVARLGLACALGATAASAGAVDVLAEDFSSGNPAAGSAYTLVGAGAFTGPGQYRVIANPGTDLTNGYNGYYDHTLNSSAGRMLFFDGATRPISIWQASASLNAGQSYTFSFWGSSGSVTSVPTLTLRIDGADVGTTLATAAATWTQYSYTFTPDASGVRTFSIVDLNFTEFGNDGAIDDILLTTPVPEPAVASLMLLGLAGMTALRRRRKG